MDKSWVVRGRHTGEKDDAAKRMRKEMMPAEAIVWNAVRGNKLDGLHFRRQQVIDGFIADFYCHTVGLVVEIDGTIHETRSAEDRQRSLAFAIRGLRTIRFTNARILNDLPTCLEEIQGVARQSQ